MSPGWKTVSLGEVCDIQIGKTPARAEERYWGEGHPWLAIADMNQGRVISQTAESVTDEAIKALNLRLVPAGTVLLSFKLSIGKVGIADQPMYTNEAIAHLPIVDEHLERDFLYWALRTVPLTGDADRAAMGATLNKSKLADIQIPLPPIEEQRRIAAVLDAADALRAKRRQALAKLDTLTQAIFIDMFGDPSASTASRREFGNLLARPLRNGISPAKGGSTEAEVLTLSAITGSAFDPEARKWSTFAKPHAPDKLVSQDDFLICRGNGNLALVGRGRHPTAEMAGTAFPDTMIAARCVKDVSPRFLEHIWAQRVVRDQLERSARTTNGTFKINQSMIESVEIPLPDQELQRDFGHRVDSVGRVAEDQRTSQEDLDTLFASLQQRAFRGEL